MAKPKFRDIKIQLDGRFNTNGTIHDNLESAFEYWDRKIPNSNTTYLLYPKDDELELSIACFSIEYAKMCIGEK